MNIVTRPLPHTSKLALPMLFALGIIMLIGTWATLYWAESLFTESHLVGYYCCVTEQDLPARGTLERTLSDFFRTSPGMHLPSLAFVAANAWFFIVSIRHARRNYWWLPYLFIAFNILYLLVDFWLVGVSWSISDRIVGPLTSAYKGYYRTWYGIALHLILWGGLFITLSKVSMKLLSKKAAYQGDQADRAPRAQIGGSTRFQVGVPAKALNRTRAAAEPSRWVAAGGRIQCLLNSFNTRLNIPQDALLASK